MPRVFLNANSGLSDLLGHWVG